MNQNIEQLRQAIQKRTVFCDVLSEEDMWLSHGPLLWKADRFEGTPHFYPVYQQGDFYSFSPLVLVLNKRGVRVNMAYLSSLDAPDYDFHSGLDTIDDEIVRIGGSHPHSPSITDVQDYAAKIYKALVADISLVESKNEGATNIILCGGKDSLNLSLLPWKNPTILLSAQPNFPYVKKFVEENGLNLDVLELKDAENKEFQEFEILENCCRVNLEHWRWGCHLGEIARNMGKVVFWKGQVGDLYMSDKWKEVFYPQTRLPLFGRKLYKKFGKFLPTGACRAIGRYIQPSVIEATWSRCAMLQGAHMGFIRTLTDSLTLSAYHGPEMMKVFSSADLASVSQVDMRDYVGEQALGRKVIYPAENPAPAPSILRKNVHVYSLFEDIATKNGIVVNR